jgi:hypothetical protein
MEKLNKQCYVNPIENDRNVRKICYVEPCVGPSLRLSPSSCNLLKNALHVFHPSHIFLHPILINSISLWMPTLFHRYITKWITQVCNPPPLMKIPIRPPEWGQEMSIKKTLLFRWTEWTKSHSLISRCQKGISYPRAVVRYRSKYRKQCKDRGPIVFWELYTGAKNIDVCCISETSLAKENSHGHGSCYLPSRFYHTS